MKKILLFRPLIYMGGTEKMMLNLISELHNYEIYIGYTDNTSDKELLNKLSQYATIIHLNNKIDISFDIAIACTWRYHSYNEFTSLKYNKLYLWVHNLTKVEQSVLNNIEETNKIDQIISVSKTLSKKLMKLFPHTKDKINTIYNILDKDNIIEKSNVPIKLNLSNNLNLVTVARVCKAKGFPRMLKLANDLKEKNIDFKWFIIGGNYNKEEENEIKDSFKEFNNQIEWFGFIDNPHNIVKQCDYSCLLSDEETWGLALTEAMTLHIPCICTDFDVSKEQIKDGTNGIILKREANNYKDRINDIINNKNKYKKAVSNYDYDNKKILKEWEKLLNE